MLDPKTLKSYEVIRVYYEYQGQGGDHKYFVVLGHGETKGKNYVLCMKATTKTLKYETDASQMAGCVYYKQGEVACFHSNTAIQPDNIHPILYEHLIEQEHNGRFQHRGSLPADFHEKLVAAIKKSETLPLTRKKNLLAQLGEK